MREYRLYWWWMKQYNRQGDIGSKAIVGGVVVLHISGFERIKKDEGRNQRSNRAQLKSKNLSSAPSEAFVLPMENTFSLKFSP
ncbi:hypothetical protein Bca4012_064991 [Brassica carinata]|uniref:Uncharacterized protein n=1 Tax=Brassica carinata TaxID=52824 RepID=A0A8X7VMZ1_BRACI|nr:hypothetical protein Bca52824_017448 [Brassica carinata]